MSKSVTRNWSWRDQDSDACITPGVRAWLAVASH